MTAISHPAFKATRVFYRLFADFHGAPKLPIASHATRVVVQVGR